MDSAISKEYGGICTFKAFHPPACKQGRAARKWVPGRVILGFMLAILMLVPGCGPDSKDGLKENELPLREELAEYKKELKYAPNDQYIMQELASILLQQSMPANSKLRIQLLAEAAAYIEQSMLHEKSSFALESDYEYLAVIKALQAAAAHRDSEAKDFFEQAWLDYNQSTAEAVLAYVSYYLPSIGWAMCLNANIDIAPTDKMKNRLRKESARLLLDEKFIGAENNAQRLFWVEAIISLLLRTEDNGDKKRLRDKALAEIRLVEDSSSLQEQTYKRDSGRSLDTTLARLLIKLEEAASAQAEKRQADFEEAYDLMLSLMRQSDYYTSYENEQFVQRIDPEFFSKIAREFGETPLGCAFMGMWQTLFDKKGQHHAEIKRLLDKSIEIAPADARVVEAYLLAARRAGYGSTLYKEDKFPLVERLACLQTGSASGWFDWTAQYGSNLGWPGNKNFEAEFSKRISRIDALDSALSCPSFAAYAKGMLHSRRSADGYAEAVNHFENAASLPHPDGAAVLIYGHLGDRHYFYVENRQYIEVTGEKTLSDAERTKILLQSREAYAKSQAAHEAIPVKGENKPGERDAPFADNYSRIYVALLASPLQPLDDAFTSAARAASLRSGSSPSSAEADLDWQNLLGRARGYLSAHYSKGEQAREREQDLYDLSVKSAESALEKKPAEAKYINTLAGLLMERAMLDEAGQRKDMLARALALYESVPAGQRTAGAYGQTARSRLYLCSEIGKDEIEAQLDAAFHEFCLATGVPRESTRARLGWAEALRHYAGEASENAAEAMRSTATRIEGK